jgi:hypothetical protein
MPMPMSMNMMNIDECPITYPLCHILHETDIHDPALSQYKVLGARSASLTDVSSFQKTEVLCWEWPWEKLTR